MPNGVINPKGKKYLDSSTRDLTPPFLGENDRSLGLSKDDPNSYIKYPPVKELPKKESPTIADIKRNKEKRQKSRDKTRSQQLNKNTR